MKKKNESQDDIVFESDLENSGGDFEKKIKKVKQELIACKKDKEEYLDGWQRTKADFVNFKKRNEEDLKSFRKYANESLLLDIIPTLDNFEAALKDHGEGEEIKKWKTGFEHIYSQLLRTLVSAGVEQIKPLNSTFDPSVHESVETIETNNEDLDQKISEVVMTGYKMGEKILRAPQVKVWALKE